MPTNRSGAQPFMIRSKEGSLRYQPYIHASHGVFEHGFHLHLHDFSEFIVVLGGEAMHIVKGLSHPLRPGDVALVPGDTAHAFIDTRHFEICNIAFLPRVLTRFRGMLRKMPGYGMLFGPWVGVRRCVRLSPRDLGRVADIARTMETETATRAPGYELSLVGLFLHLAATVCRACSPEPPASAALDGRRVAAAIAFLEDRYGRHVSLAETARAANVSANTLIRLFRQTTGVPPIEYLIRLRVWKACEQLSRPDRSIKEVAFDVGFNDTNYFARQFRQVMGMSPTEFRRRPRVATGAVAPEPGAAAEGRT
jgi:AraC-like DNA-binding protein